MKRRKFIQKAGIGMAIPSLLGNLPLFANENQSLLQEFLNPLVDTDHVLVLIYLGGGNDGLNTVIPIDSYTNLAAARNNILIPESKTLKLNGVTKTALHPSLTGFQNLYNEGKLNIIQSVGYENQNFSHFRSTDIWSSASDADKTLDTGWLGRYLNEEFPGFPLNYPNSTNPDTLALQLFANQPLLFLGPNAQMSMTLSDPNSLFQVWPNGINDAANNSPYGRELNYIRTISKQSASYASAIVSKYTAGSNIGTYPADKYSFSDVLKAIARLIKGGSKTRLYLVNLYGFDTHSNQVDATNTAIGGHADLLKIISDAVYAFQKDLEAMKLDDKVLGMTYSEFGRRIKSNDSLGTDHGAAAPLFVFGSKVQGGIIGKNPIIPSQISVNDNIPMQYDFRSIYSSILKDWFCVGDASLKNILLKSFQNLPIVNNNCSSTALDDLSILEDKLQIKIYPNPVVSTAKVEVTVPSGISHLSLIDPLGRVVRIIHSGQLLEGMHSFTIERENLSRGNYYIRLQHKNGQKTAGLVFVD
ncbi:MAG: DUF1501 domain-containing protein [Saprospiraceae bacterium]|nr:DUF1501 domain-containing protein [Saprospiraceae bacterium]